MHPVHPLATHMRTLLLSRSIIPLVTHGPYLICITAVLRDSLLYGWAVCLNWNKERLLLLAVLKFCKTCSR